MPERAPIYNHPALAETPSERIPRHILIIPDGNNTYARDNHLPTESGHLKGLQTSVEVSRALRNINEIDAVSFWVLSTKNLDKRGPAETQAIMDMVARFLRDPEIVNDFMESDVRLVHLGNQRRLSPQLYGALSEMKNRTQHNKRHTLALLIDYGWDYEFANIVEQARQLSLNDQRTPDHLRRSLVSYEQLPPVDLLIRSKGLQQLSDIGPIAGEALLDFLPKTWPEVTVGDVLESIAKFAQTNRNFGGRKEP